MIIVDVMVWISSIIPIDIGVFRHVIIVEITIIILIISILISTNILIKILILGIKDVIIIHFVEVLKVTPNFSLQD